MPKVSIRFTVISLFIFLSALIVAIMLYIQYAFAQELIKRAIDDQIKLLSSKVEDNINYMDHANTNAVNIISDFLEKKEMNDFLQDRAKYISIFTNILTKNKDLYSIYTGFEDDSFFEVINLDIDESLRGLYNAKPDDRWLFVEIRKEAKKIILLDKYLNISSQTAVPNDYFVTKRPWYIKALKNSSAVKTEPYVFSNIKAKGITYSKSIPGTRNVFSLDLLINNLNNILKEYNGTTLQNSYILDKNAKIIASSSFRGNEQLLGKITDIIKKGKVKNHILKEEKIGNSRYVYSILPLNGEFLCSYGDVDKIIEPYKEKINFLILSMFLLLFALLPLIFYFSSIIVKPIILLVKESRKVKNRQFDKVQNVNTRVLEIHSLSKSLSDMSESICEYQTGLEEKVKERTLELNEKNKELERLSVTDKLTGLYNRIKLDETIDIETRRVNRYDEIFGIIIIDIDFFKSVNDTYGHQTGDSVLREFASILKESIRKTDTVGRWGGEEFIIICPESTLGSILILADKIKTRIEQYQFSTVGHKTASFGVATYKKGEKTEIMIDRADQALYEAKKKGRNRVETMETIPDPGMPERRYK